MRTSPVALVRNVVSALSALLGRIGFAEKSALLSLALATGSIYLFAELADAMVEGDTREIDQLVLLAFRSADDLSDPLGPRWLEEMMRDFTALGSVGVLTTLSVTVVGFLALTGRRYAARMVMYSLLSGVLVSHLLKWGFDRPRPDLVSHGMTVYTQSFPSGHAMLSALVYLTLGALLARTESDPRVKVYLLTVAALLTVMVGVSRLYLGVHWPTDVLAGWVVGAGWALVCWLAMLWLQARGKVESETAHP